MVHKGELIPPASIARPLRNIAARSSNSTQASSAAVHHKFGGNAFRRASGQAIRSREKQATANFNRVFRNRLLR